VLITGESATARELERARFTILVARAETFVSVNCGAFTETLLESELSATSKARLTGATANRKGLFEAADQGTIFLDEIEKCPGDAGKAVRVLQERKVRPSALMKSLKSTAESLPHLTAISQPW